MILWRISNYRTLDGSGGMLARGRWHTMGRPIVYCAPNPATALLEVLVNERIDIEDVPVNLQYLEIEVPDTLAAKDVQMEAFGPMWRTNLEATRRAGDEWLRSRQSALFRVPSVIVPATWNVLINPEHPDSAKIRIVEVHSQIIDSRLMR